MNKKHITKVWIIAINTKDCYQCPIRPGLSPFGLIFLLLWCSSVFWFCCRGTPVWQLTVNLNNRWYLYVFILLPLCCTFYGVNEWKQDGSEAGRHDPPPCDGLEIWRNSFNLRKNWVWSLAHLVQQAAHVQSGLLSEACSILVNRCSDVTACHTCCRNAAAHLVPRWTH